MSTSKRVLFLLSVIVLFCTACKRATTLAISDSRQAEMDAYCAGRGKEDLNGGENLGHVKDFYSWKIHTCVQVEENAGPDWSYELRDISQGFLRGPQKVKSDIPLQVYKHDYGNFSTATAEGFWLSTDTAKDKQLVPQIAAKIQCNKSENTCTENDAELVGGLLQVDSEEYKIAKWDSSSVIADDDKKGICNLGHRLAIDFNSNSVIVTDYPLKTGGSEFCKAFQNANSYSLHGGTIGVMTISSIFTCTKDGISRAVISKVNELHGYVADKPFSAWMDNGEGGPPATLKTPNRPLSQADCKRAMDQMVSELSL